MFLYILLTSIIVLQTIIILKKYIFSSSATTQNPQNLLPIDFVQKLSDVIQKQQTYQEQLIQTQLMNLFRVPKLRGIQGEKWLESQLKEILPAQLYSIQYTFSTGAICDAMIFLPNDKKVPIDSKFSFDNFRKMTNTTDEAERLEFEKEFIKDIKIRINEISSKYILLSEGTIDFAFMYVPAESIYYHTFLEKDNGLLDYAFEKKVIIISPSSLYVYLQFVLYGFEGHQIQRSTQQIQEGLTGLMRDLKLFNEEYSKLKDKLDQAQKNFNTSSKYFGNAQAGLKNLTELTLSKKQQIMD